MHILARNFAPARITDRQKEMVKYIFDILDIILRLSGALLCFRASGAYFLRRIFLDMHVARDLAVRIVSNARNRKRKAPATVTFNDVQLASVPPCPSPNCSSETNTGLA